MSKRDPRADPRVGDTWTWAINGSITAYVGEVVPNGIIWLYDPSDSLPLMHCPSSESFQRTTEGWTFKGRYPVITD